MSFSAPVSHRMSMPRFFHRTNGTISINRWHDLFIARIARIARYRQVDNTIFVAREGNISCLSLAEIVFIRAFRARKNCVHSCLSCKEASCLPLAEIVFIRAVRAERIVQGSIVPSACGNCVIRAVRAERIVQGSIVHSACGNRVLSCLSCKRRIVQGRIVSSACENRVLSCLSCKRNVQDSANPSHTETR